jgi:ribokinase
VVLGSLNLDLVVEVGRLPLPGETVLGTTFRTAGGGKGANQAVAAARAGATVSMIGCVGDDSNGHQLSRLLADDGVDISRIRFVAEPTGMALILVDRSGQNLIAVVPGSNGSLTQADVAGAQDILAGASVLVAQLEIPLEIVAAGASMARTAGVAFILNAAPAQALPADLLRLVEVLAVNETELALVADQAVDQGDEAQVASVLLERGARAVVVTLGARGALVVDAHGASSIPAFQVDPVDTTAAGDAFVGVLAACYQGPASLRTAARYASAAGALACTRAGAQPSLPRTAEIERLLAE